MQKLKSFEELKSVLFPEPTPKENIENLVQWDVKIYDSDYDNKFHFECYENDYPIEVGDYFLFFFGGVASIGYCANEKEKYEINPNDRIKDESKIDLVTNFWRNCYKIKSTNYNLNDVFKWD